MRSVRIALLAFVAVLPTVSCPTLNPTDFLPYDILFDAVRHDSPGPDPFEVTVRVLLQGSPVTDRPILVEVSRGQLSPVTDLGEGMYRFTVLPDAYGLHPVTVQVDGTTATRDYLVLPVILHGAGQPLAVPGMVNTEGYEDGAVVSPDGEYLFIQYGPIYPAGLMYLSSICAETGYSLYCLGTCPPKPDGRWVFDLVGPTAAPLRPDFPMGSVVNGTLAHIDLAIPGQVDKIALFPTVFYGFKRQADGSFAQPFKVAFQDERGILAPFGLSVAGSGPSFTVALAWNDFTNELGDDKPDVYHGTLTVGQPNSLGHVTYTPGNPLPSSITPAIAPVNFTSHLGVQGNPHLYPYDGSPIQSIWVDDEQVSHDLTVYVLTSGSFPGGTWTPVTLPAPVNTAAEESQPFFTGSRLYLNRNVRIVYHDYSGPQTAAGYANPSHWGPEVVVLQSGDTAVGGIFGVGEPSIAVRDGQTWLYFVYVRNRALGQVPGRIDTDMGVGMVRLP